MTPHFNRQAQKPVRPDIKITKDMLHDVRDTPNLYLQPNGRTKLMQAYLDGHREFVAKMLKRDDVNLKFGDKEGRTLMHYAVQRRDRETVTLLLEAGLAIDIRDKSGKSAFLEIFADTEKKPDLRFAAWLVEQGANPDAADKLGRRALHFAASSHGMSEVTFLLQTGKHADKPDNAGLRPFHNAIRSNSFSVVQEFTHHRVDLTSTTNKSETVFHLALANKDEKVLHFLLKTEAVKTLNQPDMDRKRTALHEAVINEKIDAVHRMLDAGANINALDKNNKTPLALGVGAESEEIVRTLLDRGADIVHQSCSALEESISFQQSKLFPVLMEYGPDINAAGEDGTTPLMRAMQYGHSKVVTALLDAGADATALNKNNQNALFFLSRKCDTSVIKRLIKGGADINQRDTYGRTPILNAMVGNHYIDDNIKALVKAGADLNVTDEYGRSVLHHTLRPYQPDLKMFDFLVENGADLVKLATLKPPANNDPRYGGYPQHDSLLHMAAEARGAHENVLKKILDAGVPVDTEDQSGTTPLQHALRVRNGENAELLLEYGANPHKKDRYGSSAYDFARQTYNDEMLKVLKAFEDRKRRGISPKYVNKPPGGNSGGNPPNPFIGDNDGGNGEDIARSKPPNRKFGNGFGNRRFG